MSQSIPRKPVAGDTEPVGAAPSPTVRTSASGTRPFITDQMANPQDVKLDKSVQDMEYLAPLVSRMEIHPHDSEATSRKVSREADHFRPIEPVGSTSSSSPTLKNKFSNSRLVQKIKRSSLDKPLPRPPEGAPYEAVADPTQGQQFQSHPGVRPATRERVGAQPSPAVRPAIKPQPRSERNLPRSINHLNELDRPDEEDSEISEDSEEPVVTPGWPFVNRADILDSRDTSNSSYGAERMVPRTINKASDLDLHDSEDTTQHTRWAPAVTHETITEKVHEVEEQRITREFHEHHHYHRVLPIIDIEVKPARHFVETEEGLREIAQKEVSSNRATKHVDKLIAQGFKNALAKNSRGTTGPRQFTAREFRGTEGDFRSRVTSKGIEQSERYWVHPPELEKGGMDSGQTRPFHFGSADPVDDGFRDKT